jgi:hypothetical protein
MEEARLCFLAAVAKSAMMDGSISEARGSYRDD